MLESVVCILIISHQISMNRKKNLKNMNRKAFTVFINLYCNMQRVKTKKPKSAATVYQFYQFLNARHE